MPFQKATKKQAKLRLALSGPAGSGKTYTALTLATHLVPAGRIALIDSEQGSASLYADRFNFDVEELATFHPQRYIQAISDAQTAGYDVLIIDSLSHAWMGKDGALELVDRAAKRNASGNSFAAWREVTPLHNALVDAMLAARLHIIVTLRSKMEHVMDKDDKGKPFVRKVGMQPIQRDGLEYEFDVVGDLDQDNTLVVSKTRCSELLGAVIPQPNKALAATLAIWLEGEPVSDPLPVAESKRTTVQVQPIPGNGHGKPAAISTGQWLPAAKALTVRYPYFARRDGQPDFGRMTALAGQSNFPVITDANLAAVITTLEQYATQALTAA